MENLKPLQAYDYFCKHEERLAFSPSELLIGYCQSHVKPLLKSVNNRHRKQAEVLLLPERARVYFPYNNLSQHALNMVRDYNATGEERAGERSASTHPLPCGFNTQLFAGENIEKHINDVIDTLYHDYGEDFAQNFKQLQDHLTLGHIDGKYRIPEESLLVTRILTNKHNFYIKQLKSHIGKKKNGTYSYRPGTTLDDIARITEGFTSQVTDDELKRIITSSYKQIEWLVTSKKRSAPQAIEDYRRTSKGYSVYIDSIRMTIASLINEQGSADNYKTLSHNRDIVRRVLKAKAIDNLDNLRDNKHMDTKHRVRRFIKAMNIIELLLEHSNFLDDTTRFYMHATISTVDRLINEEGFLNYNDGSVHEGKDEIYHEIETNTRKDIKEYKELTAGFECSSEAHEIVKRIVLPTTLPNKAYTKANKYYKNIEEEARRR